MKKRGLIIGIIIVIVLIGGFMSFSQPESSGQTNTESLKLTGETKEFTIKASQFSFDPNIIEVNLGDKVIINAYSNDVPHGFTINNFGVNMQLLNSNIQTAEFIADKKGVFTFYCSVPCGRGHGSMRGQLVVN